MKRIIAIIKFPLYVIVVLWLILSIIIARGILLLVRLKESDFDSLPVALQTTAIKLSKIVDVLMN